MTGLPEPLEEMTKDESRIAGRRIAALDDAENRMLRSKRIGMILQDRYSSLNARIQVREIVAEPLRFHRLSDGRAARFHHRDAGGGWSWRQESGTDCEEGCRIAPLASGRLAVGFQMVCIVRGVLVLLTLGSLPLPQALAADPPARSGTRAEFELIGALGAVAACTKRMGSGTVEWVPACIDPIWQTADVSGDGALSPAEIVRLLRVLGAVLGESDAEDDVTGPDLIVIGALSGPVLSGTLMANLDYDASGLIERPELDSFMVSEAAGLDWKGWIEGLPRRLQGLDDLVPEGLDPRKRSSP